MILTTGAVLGGAGAAGANDDALKAEKPSWAVGGVAGCEKVTISNDPYFDYNAYTRNSEGGGIWEGIGGSDPVTGDFEPMSENDQLLTATPNPETNPDGEIGQIQISSKEVCDDMVAGPADAINPSDPSYIGDLNGAKGDTYVYDSNTAVNDDHKDPLNEGDERIVEERTMQQEANIEAANDGIASEAVEQLPRTGASFDRILKGGVVAAVSVTAGAMALVVAIRRGWRGFPGKQVVRQENRPRHAR
jgi:hypothetical protein